MASFVSFSLAFGGMLIAYIELSDQEASLRLFGDEWDAEHANNMSNIQIVRTLLDAVM